MPDGCLSKKEIRQELIEVPYLCFMRTVKVRLIKLFLQVIYDLAKISSVYLTINLMPGRLVI